LRDWGTWCECFLRCHTYLHSRPPFRLIPSTRLSLPNARVQFSGRRDVERLLPVFANTGIERRYSCVPVEWYAEPHGWKDRTALYVQHAVQLFETVALACLAERSLPRTRSTPS
jgi:alkylresorcinol/alkylpyrone synthase